MIELMVKMLSHSLDLLIGCVKGDLKWWQYLLLPVATSYVIGFFVGFKGSGIYK